ncbi:MAG: MgtC/SapB family protein, partial [Clostridia bacterium]
MVWWEAGLRLFLSVVIGCVIGIERERKNRPAGMRTHVLVCVGAATIAIMESLMIADTLTLNMNHASTGIAISYGRISAQVISGIGFLGAGTIFISQKKIAGLTTAASLWNVACLGLAVGMGYYWIAVAGCVIVIVTLTVLQRVVRVNAVKHVEVKFIHRVETIAFINDYFQSIGVMVLDIDFH